MGAEGRTGRSQPGSKPEETPPPHMYDHIFFFQPWAFTPVLFHSSFLVPLSPPHARRAPSLLPTPMLRFGEYVESIMGKAVLPSQKLSERNLAARGTTAELSLQLGGRLLRPSEGTGGDHTGHSDTPAQSRRPVGSKYPSYVRMSLKPLTVESNILATERKHKKVTELLRPNSVYENENAVPWLPILPAASSSMRHH